MASQPNPRAVGHASGRLLGGPVLCLLLAAFGGGCEGAAAPAFCGNGTVEAGEVCDDGGTLGGDGCSSDCRSDETCGNGVVDVAAGEACDDGNTAVGDDCQADCALPTCGDGVVDTGERCDDGDRDEGDGCNATCTSDETCGNGVVDLRAATPEQCDDGGTAAGDGCSPTCQIESCGNSVVDAGERCDDGNRDDGDGCNATCTSDETCGNGVVDLGPATPEQCDDGGTAAGDGCSPTCQIESCGNGVVDPREDCDDGNSVDDDRCSNRCVDARCGDGVVQTGEECDDINTVDDDDCTNTCLLPACGDGILQSGEACDDGNTEDDDSCSSVCEVAACGDGIVQTTLGETCDDGNVDPSDGCTSSCLVASCGDGFVQAGVEECDDGNDREDDACLTSCVVATCGDGFLQEGVEACDDGNLVDGDGCSSDCGSDETCGNGILDTVNGEVCDDGLLDGSNFCRQGCLLGVDPAVTAGLWITCALTVDGEVKCWGKAPGYGDREARGDQPGEMGAALPAIDLGTGRHALQISAHHEHVCAVLDDRSLKCWGANDRGQLGLGDTESRGFAPGQMGDALPAVDVGTGRRVMQVGAGSGHTCALLDDASVKCWGWNVQAQLGLGDTAPRGIGPVGPMGDALPAVDLGPGVVPVQLAVGSAHACVVTSTGAMKCWGANDFGNLGLGDRLNRGDEPGDMGAALPFVDLGTGRTAMNATCGEWATCVALDDGTVRCWGADVSPVPRDVGFGDGEALHGDEPDETGDGLPPLDLGTGRFAVRVSANRGRCTLFDDGAIKCWGSHDRGALGLGTGLVFIGDGPGEMGDDLPVVDLGTGRTVLSLAVGRLHACAILDGFDVKCWGRNDYGELGLGDVLEHRGDEPGEMGDALLVVDLSP